MTGAGHRRPAAGFTLVEVLVALVIMAIMAGMAWQGVDGIVRARDASQQRLDQTLRLNTVIGQWDQDLASIQDSAAVPQAIVCEGVNLRMTRRAPGGLQVVVWSLRPQAEGTSLQRWSGPVVSTAAALQDSWLRSLQLLENDPAQVNTLSGLAEWQIYYFQNTGWAGCGSTGDVTPASSGATGVRAATPPGVRVVLTFAPGSGLTGTLTRDTMITP